MQKEVIEQIRSAEEKAEALETEAAAPQEIISNIWSGNRTSRECRASGWKVLR